MRVLALSMSGMALGASALRPLARASLSLRSLTRLRGTDTGGDYYVSTPIYYVNGLPHLGHAYTSVAADVLARFKRRDGKRVFFLTGTDEHGQKVEQSAKASGKTPIEFADEVSGVFRALSTALNCSNDKFIRTTEPGHVLAVQAFWRKLEAEGHIYLGSYEGWYSVRDEAFYTEGELVDGKAPTGAPVEWVKEQSYFFRLSAWTDRLLAFYEANPDFIGPDSRRNEVVSFVGQEGGLRDLSISRTTFSWGVRVPGATEGGARSGQVSQSAPLADKARDLVGAAVRPDEGEQSVGPGGGQVVDQTDQHVVYVWLDALTNYISALGYPFDATSANQHFWPASLHLVGKDILRFHAVFWPAFLMAAGMPPPKRVFAHGWWTRDGEKMSKSVGNVLDPFALLDKYGVDYLRYFLVAEVPFGNDGDFTEEAFINRVNSNLANDFGNLAQRVLTMVAKQCDGRVPAPGPFTEDDLAVLEASDAALDAMRAHADTQSLHRMCEVAIVLARLGNKYIDTQAPWTLKKTDPPRMCTVLYVLTELVRRIAILLEPVMPGSCGVMLSQMGLAEDMRTFASLSSRVAPGHAIGSPAPVFPKIETAESLKKKAKL